MPAPDTLPGAEAWEGLRSIGLATLICKRDGRETADGGDSGKVVLVWD